MEFGGCKQWMIRKNMIWIINNWTIKRRNAENVQFQIINATENDPVFVLLLLLLSYTYNFRI